MIEIEPATVAAMTAEVERRHFDAFVGWWRDSGLPPADVAHLGKLWAYAGDRARELGIDDDDDGRVSLYAAAFGMMGELDARQFLAVADILFLDEPRDQRLSRIGEVVRGIAA